MTQDLEQRALELRRAIGEWDARITNAEAEKGERSLGIDSADGEKRAAVKAAYEADIGLMGASKVQAVRDLADCEAALESARKAPERERRAADREKLTALLSRHAKARIDIQGYAERLGAAIGELHAAEKELATFATMQRAPGALQAAGLRRRLESIGWLLRDWLKIHSFTPPGQMPYDRVTVPFEERCRRLLADLEFTDERGKPVT